MDELHDKLNAFNDEFYKRIELINGLEENIEKLFVFHEQDVEIKIESIKIAIENSSRILEDRIDQFNSKFKKQTKHYNKLMRRLKKTNFRSINDKTKNVYDTENILRYSFNESKLKSNSILQICQSIVEKYMIGKFVNPYLCKYEKIINRKSFSIPSDSPIKLAWLNDKHRLIIVDPFESSLKLLDHEYNLISSINPNSLLKTPASICVSAENEIFVIDHHKQKVFVFNSDFEYLREFGDERLPAAYNMVYDDETNLIYFASYFNNTISVWNGKSGEFVREQTINSPTFMKTNENYLYIMSAIESEMFANKMAEYNDTNNANCIYTLDKHTLQVIKRIQINNYLHPKGLEIDANLNIWTFAYDSSSATIRERSKYLFKLNQNGECVEKINIGIACSFTMIVINNRILFVLPFKEQSLHMIEFE